MQNQRCSVCLDDIQEPKCLPCLHVLCLSCLKKISHQQNCFAKQPMMELLQSVLLSCPICRHKFVTKESSIGAFPPPTICNKCDKYVGQVVEMCCGHKNENVCFDCLLRDDNNRISCPECGKYSTKSTTRRMFLCHVCHKFFPATCNMCPPTLMNSTPTLGLSRYSANENIERNGLHQFITFISIIIAVAIIGILFAICYLKNDGLSQKKFPEITCCSITVWHVDGWGNVDTAWCSGDDWKLMNAKCAMWPP